MRPASGFVRYAAVACVLYATASFLWVTHLRDVEMSRWKAWERKCDAELQSRLKERPDANSLEVIDDFVRNVTFGPNKPIFTWKNWARDLEMGGGALAAGLVCVAILTRGKRPG